MTKITVYAILALTLSSCVSLEEHKALEQDYRLYKKQSEEKLMEIKTQMELFSKTYDQNLRAELEANVLTAKLSGERIANLRKESEAVAGQIQSLKNQALEDSAVIAENRRLSSAETVVREFQALKKEWDLVVINLSESVQASREAAMSAASLTGDAAKSADSALRLANSAAKSASVVSSFSDRLRALEKQIENLDDTPDDLKKIKTELQRWEGEIHDLEKTLVQLKNAVKALEK